MKNSVLHGDKQYGGKESKERKENGRSWSGVLFYGGWLRKALLIRHYLGRVSKQVVE
jgi:hypothetical protein